MRLALSAALVVAAILAVAAPASAYDLAGRPWPDGAITYYVDAKTQSDEVVQGAKAWNALKLGVTFKRTYSRSGAELRITYGQRGCGGVAIVGYIGPRAQSEARIGRGCGDAVTVLTVVHELGHVLGLGHETSRCARMNPSADIDTGTPDQCGVRSLRSWRASPLLKDDVRGARALYSGASLRATSASASAPVWLP